MSSIIKSERVRNESFIDLSERFRTIQIEYEKAEMENEKAEIEDEALSDMITLHNDNDCEKEKAVSQEEINKLLADSHQKREKILGEANEMARNIVEEAKQRAEEILSDALKKAEEIKEETKVTQTQLLYETQTKSEQVIGEANTQAQLIKQQAETEKQALIRSSEEVLVDVLQKLLGHIVSETLFENTQWLKCMVNKMLQECYTKEEIKICVAPGLVERLTENEKEEIQTLGDKIKLEARSTLNETTCIVETQQGTISYDVMEGLDRVISEIKTLEKLS